MGDQPRVVHKSCKPVLEANTESKESRKVLFCKRYQLNECQAEFKNNVHWGTLGGKSHLVHHVCTTCLLKCKKLEHHHEKTSECPLFNKDWLVETDFYLLEFPLILYGGNVSASHTHSNSPPLDSVAISALMASAGQHVSSWDEISQYYVLPEAQDQLDFIVFDVPESALP